MKTLLFSSKVKVLLDTAKICEISVLLRLYLGWTEEKKTLDGPLGEWGKVQKFCSQNKNVAKVNCKFEDCTRIW